jgi:hypothetical protein
MRAATAAVVALTLLPAAVLAQRGSEFLANTYTTHAQQHPSVAASGTSFVVVWESALQDGSSYGVYGQRFTSAPRPAKLGAEFRVNDPTAGPQRFPSAAMDGSGNFVVVWQSAPTNTFSNVYGRRFDSSGAALGAEFRVSTFTTNLLTRNPSVAMASDGRFVVAWRDYLQPSYSIAARRYGSDGSPLGSEFRVNTSTSNMNYPSAAFAGDGSSFVIAWNDRVYGYYNVFAQRFTSSGAKLGTEFRVNTFTTFQYHHNPSVAADATGNFTVVWQSHTGIGASDDVFGKRYASTGAQLGAEFLVNFAATAGEQVHPRIASDSSGNLTVVWHQGAGLFDVLAQRFLSTGAPFGAEFSPEASGVTHTYPTVAASGSAFVVVWAAAYDGVDSASNNGVFGKRYPGPGDVNGDGVVDIADVFYLINFLFASGPDPVGPGDTSGDGSVDVADAFYLINYLFAGGPFPR